MNHFRKKAAIEKYSATPSEDLHAALMADEKNYEPEEIVEIIAAIEKPEQQTPPAPVKPDQLDLSRFDYKKLVGQSFKEYVELAGDRSFVVIDELGRPQSITGQLKENDEYVYEQYECKPVRKPRFPGMENSPMDFIGIELKKDAPINKTKIPVRIALELNSQILNAHSIAGHGRYFLLKK